MTTTNFGDLWDAHAAAAPNRTAIIQGDQTVSWSQFERRSHAIARYLHGAGLPSGAVVAQYLYNGPEYLESVYGCFKASYWPVNTNYRYTVAEITDIWTRADVQAVVFDEQFIDTVDAVRAALPNIKRWSLSDLDVPPGPNDTRTSSNAIKRLRSCCPGGVAVTTSACSTRVVPPERRRQSCGHKRILPPRSGHLETATARRVTLSYCCPLRR